MNLHKPFITTIVLSTLSLCLLTLTTPAVAGETITPLKGKININTATRRQLIMLPGIDRSLSLKIVMYRKLHKFTKIEDILKVRGVDKNLYGKIKPFIVVEGKTTLAVVSK